MEAKGYRHKVTVLKRHQATASQLMPRVHCLAAPLKRWLLGTHQGHVSLEHLDYYLDEFTFRFNRRKSGSRAASCSVGWSQQAVAVEPAPDKSMTMAATAGLSNHTM